MTTNIPPRVLILDHLEQNGPTKVAVLVKVAKIGETTTRKVLTLLEREGKVEKTGALWQVKGSGPALTVVKDKPEASGEGRRADAAKRDDDVRAYLDTEGPRTRNEIATAFGIKPSEAYLSLFRLRKGGHVIKDGEQWKTA